MANLGAVSSNQKIDLSSDVTGALVTSDIELSGSLCLHPGTTPDAHPNGSRVWVDGSGDLYLLEQNAVPSTKVQNKILRADASGNVEIPGDLTVLGATTTLDAQNLLVEDPLILLAKNNVSDALDIGFIGKRLTNNIGLIWDDSADEFAFINTTDDGTTAGNVTISSYAGLQVGELGIGSTSDSNAILTLTSTTKGLLLPRMTAAQRDDISTLPADEGLMLFDITNKKPDFYDGTIWKAFVSTDVSTFGIGSIPFATDTHHISDDNANFFWDNTNKRLGIGTATPLEPLTIDVTDSTYGGIEITNSNSGNQAQTGILLRTIHNSVDRIGNAGTYGWQLVARGDTYSTVSEREDLMLEYYDNTIFRTIVFFEHDTGNVGIGTASPTAPLEIKDPGGSMSISARFQKNANSNIFGELFMSSSADAGGFGIRGIKDSGINGSPLTFNARGKANNNAASFYFNAQTNAEGAIDAATGIFDILNNATTVFTILGDGKVGIGTGTPGLPLEVRNADDNLAIFVDSRAQAQGVGGGIAFGGKYTDAGAEAMAGRIGTEKANSTSGHVGFNMVFQTQDSVGSITERAIFTHDGKCGIGGIAPTESLDVNDNMRVRNNLIVDGAFNHKGTTVGFYNTIPIAQQTGIAVTAAAVHAALVNLGLITS